MLLQEKENADLDKIGAEASFGLLPHLSAASALKGR